jgi:hypothetical protein
MKVSNAFWFPILIAGCHGSGSGAASPEATPEPVADPAAEAPADAVSATPSEPPKAVEPALPPPVTPDEIKAPATTRAVLKLAAKGVQIYACGPKKDAPKEFEWSLKAPEANLFDAEGKEFGKHFLGPTWQAPDGSKVIGSLKVKVDAPVADAIPWLLIEATGHEGEGTFAPITFIQRVDTVGGKAPAKGCDKKHDKAETKVDYSATYYFYSTAS